MADWSHVRARAHEVGDKWGIWLTDKQCDPLADLHGALEIQFGESVNETDVFSAVLADDHPAVHVIRPLPEGDPNPRESWAALVDEAQYIVVEPPTGHKDRLVFRVYRITDDPAAATVTVEAKSIYRYVEKIPLWSTPNMPLVTQLKYRDFRAGDSLRIIKEYLMVNLMARFQPRAISGWNLWDAAGWGGINPDLWPAIVNPRHDSTMTVHTVLDARFDQAADFFRETLDAAALLLTVDMWLEGDPQPFPEHTLLRQATIILDVRTRQFDTSTTGRALDFFHGLMRTFSQENNSPFFGLSENVATADGVVPWVVWRPEYMRGVVSKFTVVKSEDATVIVGGKSPEILNKMIGAGSKAIFSGLAGGLAAIFPPFAGLITAAGTFLGEMTAAALKDKLFAWQQFENSVRRAAHGRFAYMGQVGAGDGWTLAAFQQGFQMLQKGAGMMSIAFEATDEAPYRWGRDFRAGDQQGVEHRGIIFATYVSRVQLSYSPQGGWQQQVTLGDQRARESTERAYLRSVKSIANAISRLKTFVN